MTSFLSWYLTISLVGWLAFGLSFRFLPALPDRGYTLARTLGLLLWGYIFWLLASLGIIYNDLSGLLFALLVLLLLGGWALRGSTAADLFDWLKENWRHLLLTEVLFLAAFASMALVRAANPEILGTEKPMELAFINAILNSPDFPPHDPWLSGYAISYYYFGYVMVAMIAKLTGVPGSIAFNLAVALVFGLSACGSFGVVHNLLALRGRKNEKGVAHYRPTGVVPLALLAPVFVLLVGNLGGFLEVLHARGVLWERGVDGSFVSPVWQWLDLQELSQPPGEPLSWTPGRYLWWWRASRIVQDYDFQGGYKEVIDEFPAFSYLLSDLHPHVLAMPFAFLGMALALNLIAGGAAGDLVRSKWRLPVRGLAWLALLTIVTSLAGSVLALLNDEWLRLGLWQAMLILAIALYVFLPASAKDSGLRALLLENHGEYELHPSLHINPPAFLLSAVVLGGLAFLNTWDFPFYIVIFAATYAARQAFGSPFRLGALVGDFVRAAFLAGIAGILLYLPFYLGFSSQAGGILPNVIYPSRGAHLWVMFATLWLPVFGFILWMAKRDLDRKTLGKAFLLAIGVFLGLWLVSLLFAGIISMIPVRGDQFLGSLAAPDFNSLLTEAISRRLVNFGGWLTLVVLFGLTLALLFIPWRTPRANMGTNEAGMDRADFFSLILVLVATLLVIGPEFFFLLDLFGWRINTIFKFYYQAWLLWAIVASYGSIVLLQKLRKASGLIFSITLVLVISAGLMYPFFGIWEKTNSLNPPYGWTLDGVAYLERQRPEEIAAASWLNNAPPGVVAEAIGGSYTEYGRVSMLSGLPTVLGWDFHEVQWRGNAEALGSRQEDIMRLYCTRDQEEARAILELYDIRYVFVGSLERNTYTAQRCQGGLSETKFSRMLSPVFQQGEVVIYAVP